MNVRQTADGWKPQGRGGWRNLHGQEAARAHSDVPDGLIDKANQYAGHDVGTFLNEVRVIPTESRIPGSQAYKQFQTLFCSLTVYEVR